MMWLGTIGSLAMLAAIRRAWSCVSSFALDRRPDSVSGKRLLVVVAHDEAGGAFFDRPGRHESARRGHRPSIY